ncbi:hypothetical protein ACIBEK_11510 [Nocardia fusca]|uniref:hypothetical protein n=1 Tax=Nocardia fusca TaxID=941183 RepID=UPI00378DA019
MGNGRSCRTQELILLTAAPVSRMPGAVPTVPVVRAAAHLLRDRGERVRVLVPAVPPRPMVVARHFTALPDRCQMSTDPFDITATGPVSTPR